MDLLKISPDPDSIQDVAAEPGSVGVGAVPPNFMTPDFLAAAALQAGSPSPRPPSMSPTLSIPLHNSNVVYQALSSSEFSGLQSLPAIFEDGAPGNGPHSLSGMDSPGLHRVISDDPMIEFPIGRKEEEKPAFSAEVADIISQIRAKKTGGNGTPTPPIWPYAENVSQDSTSFVASDASDSMNVDRTGATRGSRAGRGRGGRQKGNAVAMQPPRAGDESFQINGQGEMYVDSQTFPSPNAVRGGRASRGAKLRGGRGKGKGSRGGRGGNRGGRGKRKRGSNDDSNEDDDFDVAASDRSDESEHFTLIDSTRSGRKVSQVLPATPSIKIDEEFAMYPQQGGNAATPATPSSRGQLTPHYMSGRGRGASERGRRGNRGGSSKRGGSGGGGGGSGKGAHGGQQLPVLRTPGAASVCKSCARGHSPASNAIVFCDVCNKGWHQYCHDPPVPQEVLTSPDAPWFCADCTVLREEQDRLGALLKNRTEGGGLSLLEKKRYLSGLAKEDLIGMIIHACTLNPGLAIFGRDAYRVAGRLRRSGGGGGGDNDELLPYPKPGNGLRLKPADGQDAASLLIDDDHTVYSHQSSGLADLIAEARSRAHLVALQPEAGGAVGT